MCALSQRCTWLLQQPAKAVPASRRRHNRSSSSNGEPTHGRGRRHPFIEEPAVLSRCWRNDCSPHRHSCHWCLKLRPHKPWKQIEVSAAHERHSAIQIFLGRTFSSHELRLARGTSLSLGSERTSLGGSCCYQEL